MDRKSEILNPRLSAAVVGLGHGQSIVICDAGLPLPDGVDVLDLSLVEGVPGFRQTLAVVAGSLQVESAVVASELAAVDPALDTEIERGVDPATVRRIPHEEFKAATTSASLIVRTGEKTPYANVILVGGVTF